MIEIFEQDFLNSASWVKDIEGNWLFTEDYDEADPFIAQQLYAQMLGWA